MGKFNFQKFTRSSLTTHRYKNFLARNRAFVSRRFIIHEAVQIFHLNFAACFVEIFLKMIIALLTDFGTRDYFVGAMKGVILSINAKANIVNITHEIPPQDIRSASFTLLACYNDFPPETIFVAVVDPGVGSSRRAVLLKTEDYYFVAPDNGLLSFVFEEETNFRVFELTNKKFFASKISRTFHGRDIFAPVAAYLTKGVEPSELGDETIDFVRFKSVKPKKISENETQAEIIHTDNFGNLVTNLKQSDLPENFTLEVNGKIIEKQREFYAEAEKDEVFMILGSAGFLEIAAFQNRAERILSVKNSEQIILRTTK